MLQFNFIGEMDEVKACLDYLGESMQFTEEESGLCVSIKKQPAGGLIISEKDAIYTISYGRIPDFCRALCILIDKIKCGERGFTFSETRAIERCGIMADVSRNAVLKVKTAKDIISRIARMGMNTFMLYMEDVYKIDQYPYFGYMRGAYTKEELREIDRFGAIFGVEVVPCIQTLAHLKKALWWPYAGNIRDTEDILLVDEPETYEFIENMIATVADCFSSKRIHIGMDEAFGLGTGEYARRHGYVDKFEMLSRHLARVNEIVERYQLKPMMWGDMFFRLAAAGHQYYDTNTAIPKTAKDQIPAGMGIIYWDYYNEDAAFYEDMIRKHQDLSPNVSFFGGIWTWSSVTINYDKTFRATMPAMEACHKTGIQEICGTMWGDDGGETSIYSGLLGMQLYSEYIYYDKVDKEHLAKMFRICTGYNMESFLLLEADNFPEAEHYKETAPAYKRFLTVSKQVLYQDVLQGLVDKHLEHVDLKSYYTTQLEKLETAEIPQDLTLLFTYQKQLLRVLALKCDMGLRLKRDYTARDKQALLADSEDILRLKEEMQKLHKAMSALWLCNNNAIGLDRIDLRFGGVMLRLKRAHDRVTDLVNGRVERLEELDEPRLAYSTDEFMCSQYSEKFMSFSV